MSRLKKKLSALKKTEPIKDKWDKISGEDKVSTKSKLERLVKTSLKKKGLKDKGPKTIIAPLHTEVFFTKEYRYPLDLCFKDTKLAAFFDFSVQELSLLSQYTLNSSFDVRKVVFFDTETTGLAGGTGTIPFMLGFGFFEEDSFMVKIFILSDISKEDIFLNEVDEFLKEKDFSLTVTYNGKGFDFPLMETRYLLQRKGFLLLQKPHIDLLYTARMVWKNTYESRKLGFLGDILLGISREEDIFASQIPYLYFDFLRKGDKEFIYKICEHNSMDLVGLFGLMIIILHYLSDIRKINHCGEALGIGKLFEFKGLDKKAEEYFTSVIRSKGQNDITRQALLHLSMIKKRSNQLREAEDLWLELTNYSNPAFAFTELAKLYEHRAKDLDKALKMVDKALSSTQLNEFFTEGFLNRKLRINKKIKRIEDKKKSEKDKKSI